jgi:hypothetical protein
MIIDVRGIATGKTYDIMIDAHKCNGLIVCYRTVMRGIEIASKSLGIKTPTMITHEAFIYSSYLLDDSTPVFIDNAEEVLRILARGRDVPRIVLGDYSEILTGELEDNSFLKERI